MNIIKLLPSYISSDLDLATKSSKYFLQIHLYSVTNGEVKVCQLFDLICVFICILCKQFNKANEIFSFCRSLTLSLQLKRRQYHQYTVIAIKRQPLPCWTQFQCMMIIWWYFKKWKVGFKFLIYSGFEWHFCFTEGTSGSGAGCGRKRLRRSFLKNITNNVKLWFI